MYREHSDAAAATGILAARGGGGRREPRCLPYVSGVQRFVLVLVAAASSVRTSGDTYGVHTRRKGPSGVTVNTLLTTSGSSELLQKTSIMCFAGYFHVIGV